MRTAFVMLMAVRGRKRDTLPQFPHDANSNVWRPRLGGKFCTSIIADGRTDRQTCWLARWLLGDCRCWRCLRISNDKIGKRKACATPHKIAHFKRCFSLDWKRAKGLGKWRGVWKKRPMSKSREPFRLADRHFISFDSALLFGQPQNDSIERTRRPGGGGRDCPAQCCDEYDTLFRHLTHAACHMPVALSAQFNRLSSLGEWTGFRPIAGSQQNCCLLCRAARLLLTRLALHAHTIIKRNLISLQIVWQMYWWASLYVWLCVRVWVATYWIFCCAAANPLM